MYQNVFRNLIESDDLNMTIKSAWKHYQESGVHPDANIRGEILHSWEESRKLVVNPLQKKINDTIDEVELKIRREQNEQLLSFTSPKLESVIDILYDSKTILSITDKHGTILHSEGEESVVQKAEKINIFDGSIWSEESAGTNAVGIVKRTKQSAQVLFSEHFCERNHGWYCIASPVLAPYTKELIGIINIAGYANDVHKHTIGLIISKANNIAMSFGQQFHEHAYRHNLFLNTALENIEDAVFVVDSHKNITVKNNAARAHTFLNQVQSVEAFPELNKFVDYVLKSGQEIKKESVSAYNWKQKFICTINPVRFQSEHLGAVIFLKENAVAYHSKPTSRNAQLTKSTYYSFNDMVGSSKAFLTAANKAQKAAMIDTTLFLSGETGTGKELFAQSIHQASSRSTKPFIAINCGAIPQNLLESELSGYEAGAFTGATSKGKPGKFELADGGTIFLDEIGDMPLDLQVHLLRILEERVVTRIGGKKEIPVDVRVIAATHKNLTKAVANGEFREDLMYRLRVIQLEIPALRERIADIPELVTTFINEVSAQFGKYNVTIHQDAMDILTAYDWPGNIRELKNVIQQALFNMEGNELFPFDLPPELLAMKGTSIESEEEHLIELMIREKGNVTNAAKALGVSRATMYRRIKQYNLTNKDWLIEK